MNICKLMLIICHFEQYFKNALQLNIDLDYYMKK